MRLLFSLIALALFPALSFSSANPMIDKSWLDEARRQIMENFEAQKELFDIYMSSVKYCIAMEAGDEAFELAMHQVRECLDRLRRMDQAMMQVMKMRQSLIDCKEIDGDDIEQLRRMGINPENRVFRDLPNVDNWWLQEAERQVMVKADQYTTVLEACMNAVKFSITMGFDESVLKR